MTNRIVLVASVLLAFALDPAAQAHQPSPAEIEKIQLGMAQAERAIRRDVRDVISLNCRRWSTVRVDCLTTTTPGGIGAFEEEPVTAGDTESWVYVVTLRHGHVVVTPDTN